MKISLEIYLETRKNGMVKFGKSSESGYTGSGFDKHRRRST